MAAVTVVAALGVAASPAVGNEEFVAGSGRSEARIVRFGPSASRLALAPTLGLSLADYLNTLGRGESRVLEYAALDDSIPPEFKDRVPPVRAESTDEGAAQGKSRRHFGTPPEIPVAIGATEQRAAAEKTPVGRSGFSLGFLRVPGVIEIEGAVAESRAGLVDGGKAREAVGTTRIAELRLGGDAVVLTGLRWQARQRTGAGAEVKGSFTVEGVTINGEQVTVPDSGSLAPLVATINEALSSTGIAVEPARASTAGGVASVTPLRVRIADSEAGAQLIGPVIGGAQPVREPITRALIDANPEFSTAILLADVTVGVFSGAGRLDLDLGGAMAYTEGQRFENPFDFDLGAPTPALDAPVPSATTGASSFAPDAPRSGFAPGDASPPAPTGGGQVAGPASPGGVLANASTPTSRTAAVAVGAAGLLAALGVAALDYRAMRASRRTIPSV